MENLERERDFYYAKLREVEVLCQQKEGENIPFLKEVLDILYKMDEGDEFAAPQPTDDDALEASAEKVEVDMVADMAAEAPLIDVPIVAPIVKIEG